MVECECPLRCPRSSVPFRFNRYMVECELIWESVSAFNWTGFNRYMVECESFKSWQMMCLAVVLIDTWWNVNSNEEALNRYMAYVLIDTWWNVN